MLNSGQHARPASQALVGPRDSLGATVAQLWQVLQHDKTACSAALPCIALVFRSTKSKLR